MADQPLILVTNDDGWDSPGLLAAAKAVCDLGEVLLVSPYTPQTATGRAVIGGKHAGIIRRRTVNLGSQSAYSYSVEGTPALVVGHAILEIAARKPNLCVSGINDGENIGLSALISGTIGAAFEADSYDIPGVAVSLAADYSGRSNFAIGNYDMNIAKNITRLIISQVLNEGFPANVSVLNINIPRGANSHTEIRRTIQSRQSYRVFSKPRHRQRDAPYRLKFEVAFDRETLEPESDIKALAVDQVVSVTPMTWSMTAVTKWTPWSRADMRSALGGDVSLLESRPFESKKQTSPSYMAIGSGSRTILKRAHQAYSCRFYRRSTAIWINLSLNSLYP
jgi:5'-nucleotidase